MIKIESLKDNTYKPKKEDFLKYFNLTLKNIKDHSFEDFIEDE